MPPIAEPLAADETLFDEAIQNASVPVLVDFWAEWCGPCRMAAPEVSRTAADMAGKALVLKVDTDKHPQIAARFQVRGIPTFAVFSGGHLFMQQAGVVDHSQIAEGRATADPADSANNIVFPIHIDDDVISEASLRRGLPESIQPRPRIARDQSAAIWSHRRTHGALRGLYEK